MKEREELPVGSSVCECADCLERFTSVSAFDMHLVGHGTNNPRCLTPKQMERKGMKIGKRGYWTTGIEIKHKAKA